MTVKEEYDLLISKREETPGRVYCCPFCYLDYETRLEKDNCLDNHGFIILKTTPLKEPTNATNES